jgi:hypothetical protein
MLLLVLLPGAAIADTAALDPVEMVSYQDGADRLLLLRFDLSGLRAGIGLVIADAFIELPSGELGVESRFVAVRPTEDWASADVLSGRSQPELESSQEREWIHHPGSKRSELVRLDVRDVVSDWAHSRSANFGVAVRVTGAGIETQRALDAPLAALRIRYGFMLD